VAFQQHQRVNCHYSLVFPIAHMKMWWGMIVIEHGDDDTEETTKFSIPHLSEPFIAAEGYAFRGEKSPRLSRDVKGET